ncbi:protein kintoun [Phyllobates terribilis]|uniref:protein kintoun n=1 Tax=Phyllobates terribilis TaxID=111132 RepID=UPI003CCA8932
MATKLEELSVTSEELERFKVAFQDARFRELFAQYAEELSNPENRRRYEEEIREMERERGMDVQFVHPEAGHVLRTSVDGRQTCYLNLCTNAVVRKPHCVAGTDKDGRLGTHWSLPCTLTLPREEQGPGGGRELIYDVVFHPDTLRLASKSDKFRSMVDLTALNTVSQQFNVNLDTGNVTTLSEKYKGVPQTAVIRKPLAGAAPKPQDPADPLRFPYPYDEKKRSRKTTRPLPSKPHRERPTPLEPTVPRYTIRHRSYVDLQDYRDARDSAPSPVPKELVITVDMPLLGCGNDVNLHIKDKDLSLESQKPAYKLQLKLPYLVEDERGTAQFNKIKRQLVITVPVVQQNLPKLIPAHPPASTPKDDDSPQPNGIAENTEMPPLCSLPQDHPECPIFTCSQDATTLTLIIHVKDIDKHSVTSEASSYQCEIRFCVKTGNSPYVLFVSFLPQYNLNTHYIAVNVSADNMVIELTKSSECFGPWKNLFFGVNSNSLQERRFINEENVSEFLENGLRPSTIPWSTTVDQPLIDVMEMTDRRTHIRLNKPELEEERLLTDGDQSSGLSGVTKLGSSRSDNTDQSDTDDTTEERWQSPHPAVDRPTSPAAQCPVQLPGTDHSTEDDEYLCTPAKELDEDDLPECAELVRNPLPNPSNTEQVLQDVASCDSSALVLPDHRTQCAFAFDNALLFDLD